jgi:cytochrome c biogenesis protein CcmG/thiol:disulfide interchange protein DsbE
MRNTTLRLAYLIPIILVLFILLGQVTHDDNNMSPGFGVMLPPFEAKNLWAENKVLTETTLRGQVSLLTIWATWCAACLAEHSFLLNIQNNYHIPIYSLNYKDNPAAARAWLVKNGNPFITTGMDTLGNISHNLGVQGTPTTFLVDKQGIIRYRHTGILDDQAWRQKILPLINQYKK